MNNTTYNDAINLMIEDLHKKDYRMIIEAKKLNCEQELDEIKTYVIQQLSAIKSNLL